ncbi:hypothetical protein SAMN04489712_11229 [Thermomonospora echinospora]|uniref:Uncharacterized protein n=2 Tax=Thermomonospora echinospora TaxID=1992 RepID=A0A1H6CZ64_9ACTN|nr:hypothetical protein SAMN04489712_11229 [Thermomonospora echinospora]
MKKFAENASLTAVEVQRSRLSGVRTVVNVIFAFTDRTTDKRPWRHGPQVGITPLTWDFPCIPNGKRSTRLHNHGADRVPVHRVMARVFMAVARAARWHADRTRSGAVWAGTDSLPAVMHDQLTMAVRADRGRLTLDPPI